mmetsp:Transcript_19214/g.40000  ORF Transcript_19214/g.40000 Transcript_19214/m.40000 type:complete len:233 (+) Transcript_19214:3-701(+)
MQERSKKARVSSAGSISSRCARAHFGSTRLLRGTRGIRGGHGSRSGGSCGMGGPASSSSSSPSSKVQRCSWPSSSAISREVLSMSASSSCQGGSGSASGPNAGMCAAGSSSPSGSSPSTHGSRGHATANGGSRGRSGLSRSRFPGGVSSVASPSSQLSCCTPRAISRDAAGAMLLRPSGPIHSRRLPAQVAANSGGRCPRQSCGSDAKPQATTGASSPTAIACLPQTCSPPA